MAFEMYRNYDGMKSTFGSKLAVYAASRTSDGALTIMVINKTFGSLADSFSISNLTSTAIAAQVYRYSNANLNAIVAQPAARITAGSGTNPSTISNVTFPAQSITLFVIRSH